jgi:hypothetical protein
MVSFRAKTTDRPVVEQEPMQEDIPASDFAEQDTFSFALVHRRVGSISRAARELINVISQQLMKNMQPST